MLGSQTGGGAVYDQAMGLMAAAADPEGTKKRLAEMAEAKAAIKAENDLLGVAREIETARAELEDAKAEAKTMVLKAKAVATSIADAANALSAKTAHERAVHQKTMATESAELNDGKARLEARWVHVREQTGRLENQLADATKTMGEATLAKTRYHRMRDELLATINRLDGGT